MSNFTYSSTKPTTLRALEADVYSLAHANLLEKNHITESLTEQFTVLPDPNIEFKLSEVIVTAPYESSLILAQRAGQSKLRDILSSTEFRNLEELSSLPDSTTYVCDDNKRLQDFFDGTYIHIDDILKENAVLSRELDELSDYASGAGGFIYSNDNINAEQWFRFYGHPMPSNARQLANLMNFLTKERWPLQGTGNYYNLLKDPEISQTALSLRQREQIMKSTALFGMAQKGQLLGQLVKNNMSTAIDFKAEPDRYLSELMQGMVALNLAQECIKALDWYGSEADDSSHPADLQQLLMAAIVLNIDANIGETESEGRVQGYELYQPANVDRHPNQIMRSLEQHLVSNNIIEAHAAAHAAYILIADQAPEFLVREIPQAMTIGSPAWVAHSISVAKTENMVPGSSRKMTFEQVQAYADLEPFDDDLEQQFSLAVIIPLLKWASTNGVITYNADGQYTADDLKTAETLYTHYTEALEQCSNALNTPLPTRSEMALQELRRAMPDGDYLTNKHYVHLDGKGRALSAHDLFMSGDLLLTGWTGVALSNKILSTPAPWELNLVQPYLGRLQNIFALFNSTFNNYFDQLQLAISTALKLAITKIPEEDRIRLEFGAISIYTVREQFSEHTTKETQRLRNKHRGRYGVIICASQGSQRYYYELFTLRSLCVPRPDLRDVFATTPIEYFTATESADMDELQWQAQGMEWPLDLNAYLNGTEPVKNARSKVVVEKLYESFEELDPPSSRSHVESFFAKRTSDTVRKIIECSPPARRDELYDQAYGLAPLEAARDSSSTVDTILNLIIPFKSCIEEMASGDADRQKSAVVGCLLDVLSVVGAVAGVAPKFASVAMKTGSMLSKSIRLVKLSAGLALSLVNPLDGYPSLFKKGANITKKGVLLISGRGASASGSATRKIRSISGAHNSLNAVKSLSCTDMKFARLDALAEMSQATDVLLVKRASDWYQLDLDTLQPRGEKVTSFKEISRVGASDPA